MDFRTDNEIKREQKYALIREMYLTISSESPQVSNYRKYVAIANELGCTWQHVNNVLKGMGVIIKK